jgi:hypothetical protein
VTASVSVDANHHIARLDDRISALTASKLQLIRSFVGDLTRNNGATDVNCDVSGSGTLFYLDYFSLEFIAGAELHGLASRLCLMGAQKQRAHHSRWGSAGV